MADETAQSDEDAEGSRACACGGRDAAYRVTTSLRNSSTGEILGAEERDVCEACARAVLSANLRVARDVEVEFDDHRRIAFVREDARA